MSKVRANKAFRQPGFQFGTGDVFGSEATNERIFTAIAGSLDSDLSGHAAKREVRSAIEGLFKVLNEKAKLVRALRDTSIFWGVVAINWETPGELAAADVRLIAQTYVKGRKAVAKSAAQSNAERNQETTDLGDAVDTWIAVEDRVRASGPQPKFTVTIRQHPVTIAARDLANLDLSAGSIWPPQLCDHAASFPFSGRIRKRDVPAIPDSLTYPQDMKLFLCWAALARYDPTESKFAVFMAPIAFMDRDDRKDNYLATGSLSKRMATIGEFFDYALEMLNHQGRDMGRPPGGNDRCVRHGLGLALRRTPNRGSRVPGYQVILYDPEHAHLKNQPRKPRTADKDHDELIVNMHEWREEVELVADKKLGKKFAELWCGGRKPALLQREYGVAPGDSVSRVAGWVFDAVSGRFPTAKAPVVELEDKWGYEFIDTMHGPQAIKKKAREDESDDNDDDDDDEESGEEEESEEEEEEEEEDSDSDSEYEPSD
ncbi:hypothetical protein PG995_002868 [Apiospora arundinis]